MILKIKVRCNPDAADPKQTMGVTVRVWGGGGAGIAPLRAGCAGETAGGLKERGRGARPGCWRLPRQVVQPRASPGSLKAKEVLAASS